MLTFLSLSEPTIAPDREANVDLSTTERSQSLLKSSLSFFFWSARMWKTFSSDGITNGCFDHSLFQTIAHSLYVGNLLFNTFYLFIWNYYMKLLSTIKIVGIVDINSTDTSQLSWKIGFLKKKAYGKFAN